MSEENHITIPAMRQHEVQLQIAPQIAFARKLAEVAAPDYPALVDDALRSVAQAAPNGVLDEAEVIQNFATAIGSALAGKKMGAWEERVKLNPVQRNR